MVKFTKETFSPKLKPDEIAIITGMALGGMIIGLIAMSIYLIVYVADSLTFRVLVGFNTLCGVLFLGVNLYGVITQIKMLKAMGAAQDILQIMKGGDASGQE